MKEITPDFYKDFHCIGGACRHNCCIGWDVEIDEDTADFYRSIGGEMGKRFAKEVRYGKEGAAFRMGADRRCPFLNRQNLCDIITDIGEGGLCQICADHPRFRADFSDRIEFGLGMACEEAARLLLTHEEPLRLVVAGDDGEDEGQTEEEQRFFGRRAALLTIAQDRTYPVYERTERLARAAGIDGLDLTTENWIGFFEDLETAEPESFETLCRLMHASCHGKIGTYRAAESSFEIPAEQVLVYFLYRYLSHAVDEEDYRARVGFSILGCRFLMDIWDTAESEDAPLPEAELVDLARRYSAEVEYSEENVGRILGALRREIRDKVAVAAV